MRVFGASDVHSDSETPSCPRDRLSITLRFPPLGGRIVFVDCLLIFVPFFLVLDPFPGLTKP